MGTVIILPRWW